MSSLTMTIRAVSGALGAEVLDVDLTDLDDRLWTEIRARWLDYLVLFFPAQRLNPAAHIALARRFGEP
ncbi:MAG: TauD/TfdA family dioxygenase, partial [Actinobacteria bacterium]